MLDSTLDLLTQAASNSLFVFCFCNLIIVMIFLGSKPGSYFHQESEIPLSMATKTNTNYHKQVENDRDAKWEQKGMINSSIVFGHEVSNAKKELACDESDDNGSNNHHNDSKECDNEDELRRRVEEFIEKVNKGWRAELLRTSHLI